MCEDGRGGRQRGLGKVPPSGKHHTVIFKNRRKAGNDDQWRTQGPTLEGISSIPGQASVVGALLKARWVVGWGGVASDAAEGSTSKGLDQGWALI